MQNKLTKNSQTAHHSLLSLLSLSSEISHLTGGFLGRFYREPYNNNTNDVRRTFENGLCNNGESFVLHCGSKITFIIVNHIIQVIILILLCS